MHKVLLVTGSLHVGGMETVAMNIAKYSDRNKFKVDFLVYGNDFYELEKEAESLNCSVYRIPFPHDNIFAFKNNVKNILRKYGPYDIVHCHNLFNCGYVMKAAYEVGVPVRISHSHTNRVKKNPSFIHRVYEKIMRRYMVRYSTQLYACSNLAGEYLFGNSFTKNGFVLKNGIDVDQVQNENASIVFNDLKKNGCKIIGQIGTLCTVKNHTFSIDLFKLIKAKYENVKMFFVGDGPLRSQLEEKVKKLGLENDIYFMGTRKDVLSILKSIDLFLMPSIYEGVSVALIEAQTSGLNCLVSSKACAPEVHVTNQIGILDLADPMDLWAERAISLMTSPKHLDSISRIVESGYSIRHIMENLSENYETYLNKSK